MSDEEYDEYGYGDGTDGERDDDYGDDDYGEDDYKYYEQPEIVDFAYRDIGSEGRIGGPIDEDLGLPMGTIIQGGNLGKFQQQFAMQNITPEENFAMSLQKILREEDLQFTDDEQRILKQTMKKLPFIRYKNPLTYVLGYYIQLEMSPNMKVSRYLTTKIKKVEQYVKNEDSITMFEVMKYARYWQMILLK